jgi:hypothetical protein
MLGTLFARPVVQNRTSESEKYLFLPLAQTTHAFVDL